MATNHPDPPEVWCPMFTRYFTDEQIIRDAVSRSNTGLWCRLCDSPVTGESAEAHTKRHDRELKDWRKKRTKTVDHDRIERLKLAREERKRQKEAGLEPKPRETTKPTSRRKVRRKR